MKITNNQAGPRGVNAIGGPVLIDPKQTVDVEVYAREKEHLEATGWFDIKGDYTSNPDGSAGPALQDAATDATNEIENLKTQLADLQAKLDAKGDEPDRDDLKKQADELGIEYPANVKTAKLKELIDAKLAE